MSVLLTELLVFYLSVSGCFNYLLLKEQCRGSLTRRGLICGRFLFFQNSASGSGVAAPGLQLSTLRISCSGDRLAPDALGRGTAPECPARGATDQQWRRVLNGSWVKCTISN